MGFTGWLKEKNFVVLFVEKLRQEALKVIEQQSADYADYTEKRQKTYKVLRMALEVYQEFGCGFLRVNLSNRLQISMSLAVYIFNSVSLHMVPQM